MGNVDSSPEILIARKAIEVWRAVVTKKSGGRYSSKKFCQIERRAQLHNSMNASLQEAKTQVQLAEKHYREMKKKATSLRKTFLRKRAEEIANEGTNATQNIYLYTVTKTGIPTTSIFDVSTEGKSGSL